MHQNCYISPHLIDYYYASHDLLVLAKCKRAGNYVFFYFFWGGGQMLYFWKKKKIKEFHKVNMLKDYSHYCNLFKKNVVLISNARKEMKIQIIVRFVEFKDVFSLE